MYTLVVVAIFKNESHILKEWLEHYLLEGVDHFYLIDNCSTDNFRLTLAPYQRDHLVDCVTDSRPHLQEELYNQYFLGTVKKDAQWSMVVDLDEFIYSRQPYPKISDYLRSLPENIIQVVVPWKVFGSSGLIRQPVSCIDSFTTRESYMATSCLKLTKTIGRTNHLTRLGIHRSVMTQARS